MKISIPFQSMISSSHPSIINSALLLVLHNGSTVSLNSTSLIGLLLTSRNHHPHQLRSSIAVPHTAPRSSYALYHLPILQGYLGNNARQGLNDWKLTLRVSLVVRFKQNRPNWNRFERQCINRTISTVVLGLTVILRQGTTSQFRY